VLSAGIILLLYKMGMLKTNQSKQKKQKQIWDTLTSI
jgi:hypothetical protein